MTYTDLFQVVFQLGALFRKSGKISGVPLEEPNLASLASNSPHVGIQWLENTAEYQTWLVGQNSSHLALIAETGFGKTRFLHRVVRSLSNSSTDGMRTVVVYVPCQDVKKLTYKPSIQRRRKQDYVTSTLRGTRTIEEDASESDATNVNDDRSHPSAQSETASPSSEPVTNSLSTDKNLLMKPVVADASDPDMVQIWSIPLRFDHLTIIRMIIIAILHQNGHGVDYMRRIFDHYQTDLQCASLQDFLHQNDQSTADLLLQLIEVIVREMRIRTLVIVIDGLETLLHNYRIELAKMLRRLPNLQHQSQTLFRVLIAGRPEVNLASQLDGYSVIDSQSDLNGK